MAFDVSTSDRRRSGWAGVGGACISLGATELFAGLTESVPSAISAIGSFVVDLSPPWLKSFAIETFGTADKAVLAVAIFAVALVIAWVLGWASTERSIPIVIGFGVAGVVGLAAQLAQPGVSPVLAAISTFVSAGLGVAAWFGIVHWARQPVDTIDDEATDPARRRLLGGLAAVAVVTAIAIAIGRGRIRSRSEAQRAALLLPEAIEVQIDPTAAHEFALEGVAPIVVPHGEFYRIDTALVVPTIDPAAWTLTVKGMVDDEIVLTYGQISAMPLVERYVTLACVSNKVGDGLVGNALWTGVPLRDLIDMAGVRPGAEQVVGRSVDGFTTGFPLDAALDGRDALVAIGMNREILPADHGFPARLVVPGLYGYVSATKWLSEIELTTWDAFDGYWIPRGWSKEAPIKTQSRIDRPRHRETIDAGPYVLGGVAWAPTLGIDLVEVQVDGGAWIPADISEPLSLASWVQWKLEVQLSEGEHSIAVRATDGTGFTQRALRVPARPDGAEGWHTIRVNAEAV